MKIVADQGNRDYYLHAAMIEIQEAMNKYSSMSVIRAIRLLVLAEVWRRK